MLFMIRLEKKVYLCNDQCKKIEIIVTNFYCILIRLILANTNNNKIVEYNFLFDNITVI